MLLTVRPFYFFEQIENSAHLILPVPMRSADSASLLEQAILIACGRLVGAGKSEDSRIWEIGTYKGQTARALAQNFVGASIHTLDLNPSNSDAALANSNVLRHRSHSATFDFSPYYGECALAFIDGGHDYPTVKVDTENAFRLLRKEGPAAIVWHDRNIPDVGRHLSELAENMDIHLVEDTLLGVFLRNC